MDRTDDQSALESVSDELELGRALGAPAHACDREVRLYARYVRVLALLCECAPYVDEASYAERIDEALADACAHYPLEWRRSGCAVEISPCGIDGERRIAPWPCVS